MKKNNKQDYYSIIFCNFAIVKNESNVFCIFCRINSITILEHSVCTSYLDGDDEILAVILEPFNDICSAALPNADEMVVW